MNASYVLHAQTKLRVMQDGSGIVLFGGLNGRSVFIQNRLFGNESSFEKFTELADSLEHSDSKFQIQSILNLSEDEALKVETWLLNNDFISAYSH